MWQAALKRAFKGYSSAVVVDVNLEASAPFTAYSPRLTEAQFANLFALQVGRAAVLQSTGWVFVRQAGSSLSRFDASLETVKWLSKVPDEELSLLCRSAIAFNDLSEGTKRLLARYCQNPGLQEKMANGEFAAASVRLQVMFSFKDKNGALQTYAADPFQKDSEAMQEVRSKVELAYKQPPIVVETKRILLGDLDFSEGRLLRLDELMAEARKAFGKHYMFDGRLSQSYVYVQGKFTDKTFLEFMKAVQNVIEPSEISVKPDEVSAIVLDALKNKVAKLIDSSALIEGISSGDVFENRQMSLADLAKLAPAADALLRAHNVPPDTMVTLIPGLEFQLVAPGSTVTDPKQSPLGNSWAMVVYPRK